MKSMLKLFCDDNALEEEPVINVDYLSNVWRDEDIWATRRYVLREKKALKNSTRLENALWRTWTKHQQQLNTVSPDCVSWEKDSDITWLYGPWKSTEPSRNPHVAPAAAIQISHEYSELRSAIRPALKRRAQLFSASCTPLGPESPTNPPLVLEKDVLKTGGAWAWSRLPCPQYPLSRMAASATRFTREWSRRIWPQFPSTNLSKVHFDLEVRQCIALDSTITHDTAYDESSLFQSPLGGFDDAFRLPGEYYLFMDSSLFYEKSQGQTITQLPSTGLKSSHGPIEHRQEGADNIDTEDDIFFL